MNWLLLTLMAIVARATYGLATKVLSKYVEVSAVTHSILITTFAGLLSFLIIPFVGGISFAGIEEYWLSAVLMVVSQALANVIYFVGIKKLDSGTTQIAFSSILIWGAILAVFFLDSVFSVQQLIGIVLMLLAILMVQYSRGKLEINPGVLYIIGSAMLFAVFQVASADLSKVISTGAYLLMAYLGPSLILGVVYFSTIKKDFSLLRSQLKNTSINTLFASGTSLLYFTFSYLAFREAPDRGIVVVLLTAQVVLAVIFGIIFLKEKDNKTRKLLAGLLAFAAGILIKG